MCITARLKFQKFFKYFFTGKTLPLLHSIWRSLGKGRGLLCEARVLGFARGSWRWGCAEEWLGLKGPQVRLAYARWQGTKNLSFYTQGYPNITYDRNSFQEHVGVLYLLVKIHKKPSVETRRVKNKYYRNGSCQIKVFFCWTLRSAPPSRSTLGIPGIVDIG
jgi:hypothetical protein